MLVSIARATQLSVQALSGIGYPPADAAVIADHLVDCELRGLGFSGLARILSVAERIGDTGPANAPVRVVRDSPVSAQLDGADNIGYLVARQATATVIEKAAVTGLAAVGANNTWYTGMLSYYAEMITARGLVAMIASNATPWVAPFGGSQARFGTNPFCFGFPSATADEPDAVPLIWDIGTSEIIHAQAVLARRTESALPEGVAYGPAGAPTVDPAAALAGAFVAWGGHKGSGLAICVQLLGALAGSPLIPDELTDFGFLALAIDPELFGPAADFTAKVRDYAGLLRATRPTDPATPVRVPFERSAAVRARRRAEDAVDIDDIVLDAVGALGSKSGCDPGGKL
jgi:delta1-piperideine-2-carboxylate reductase